MKIVDFKTVLKERDQRNVVKKVNTLVVTYDIPGNSQKLKQHFCEWLVLETEKKSCQEEFTNHFSKDRING